MPDVTYPLDLTGNAATNLVQDELHTVTEANYRDYFFIVPNYAPFYVDNFQMSIIVNHIESPLQEGVHYNFALPYVAGIRSTGKTIYGAVTLNNLDLTGVLKITYQTVGGEWVVNRLHVLTMLAEKAYNPRMTIWDTVTDKPNVFPPIPHYQDFENFYGMEQLVAAINNIRDFIIAERNEAPIIQHLGNESNPHNVTLAQLGYSLATVQDVIGGNGDGLLINVPTLLPFLENLNQAIETINNSLLSDHVTPKISKITHAYVGAEGEYQITDYDENTNYTLVANNMLASRIKDKISFCMADVPNTSTLTVNGREFSLNVSNYLFEDRFNIQALAPAADEQFGYSIAMGSDLYFTAVGCPETNKVHAYNIQMDVANETQTLLAPDVTHSDFGQAVYITPNNQYMLVGCPVSNNNTPGKVYSYRNISGAWVLLNNVDGFNPDDLFGSRISANADGSIIAISSPGYRRVDLYAYSNGVLTHITDISSSDDGFGWSISLNTTGKILAIANTQIGCVDVYVEISVGNWRRVGQTIYTSLISSSPGFGASLSISPDGQKIAIGYPDNDSVHIYTWTGSSWDMTKSFQGQYTGDRLGSSVVFGLDNESIYVGCPGHQKRLPVNDVDAGGVYVIKLIDGEWVIHAKIIPQDGVSEDGYGEHIAMNVGQTYMLVSAPHRDIDGQNNSGVIYALKQV